jgi:hypothetical protein
VEREKGRTVPTEPSGKASSALWFYRIYKRRKARYIKLLVATVKCKETEVLDARQLCIHAICALRKQFTNVMAVMLYFKLKTTVLFQKSGDA